MTNPSASPERTASGGLPHTSPLNPQGDLVWNDADRIIDAIFGSHAAKCRVQMMKCAVGVYRPTAAPSHFPYRHRTCAEWIT